MGRQIIMALSVLILASGCAVSQKKSTANWESISGSSTVARVNNIIPLQSPGFK